MASQYCNLLRNVIVVLVALISVVQTQTLPDPSFDVEPTDTSAAVGHTVTIYCSVANLGRHQVFWNIVQNSSTEFTLGPNVNLHASYLRFKFMGDPAKGEYNLRISDVIISDAGTYTCLVHDPNNPVALAMEAGAGAKLTVFENIVGPLTASPMCEMSSNGNNQLEKGDVLTLTCTSRGGIPLPELSWERVKENNVTYKLYSKTTVKGDMVTTSAKVNISSIDHQSFYKCIETHPVTVNPRTCETESPMNVRFKPEVTITPDTVKVQVLETTKVTLSCTAYAYPALTSGPKIILPTNKTGDFNNDKTSVELELTTEDVGKIFYCQAVNEIGVGEDTVEITQRALLPTWLTLVIIGAIAGIILIFITLVGCILCVDRSGLDADTRSNKSRPTSTRKEEDDFIDGYQDDMIPIEDFQGGQETIAMHETDKTATPNDFETGEAGPRYQNVNQAFQRESFQSNSFTQSNPSSSEPIIDSNFD